jgi:hypothetical protein
MHKAMVQTTHAIASGVVLVIVFSGGAALSENPGMKELDSFAAHHAGSLPMTALLVLMVTNVLLLGAFGGVLSQWLTGYVRATCRYISGALAHAACFSFGGVAAQWLLHVAGVSHRSLLPLSQGGWFDLYFWFSLGVGGFAGNVALSQVEHGAGLPREAEVWLNAAGSIAIAVLVYFVATMPAATPH